MTRRNCGCYGCSVHGRCSMPWVAGGSVLVAGAFVAVAAACSSGAKAEPPQPADIVRETLAGDSLGVHHDTKRGVTCWRSIETHSRGIGVALSCLPDSLLRDGGGAP